jgi:DNA-binding NarL/FixJ family response regulator
MPEQIDVMLASRRVAMLPVLLRRLTTDPGMRLVGAPRGDLAQLPDLLAVAPDVLLLDDALLDATSLRRLHQRCPHVRVLLWCEKATAGLVPRILGQRCHGFLLTRDSPETLLKAFRAVCRGELWLPRAMLADAVRKDMQSRDPEDAALDAVPTLIGALGALTRREAEVVERLRQGFTNKEIGRELGIMEDTVKKHLQSVFAKLGVHRRGLVMLRQAPASPADR